MTYSGDQYKLTKNGWRVADGFWQLKILAPLTLNKLIADKETTASVELIDGQQEMDELRRHLDALEESGFVSLQKIRGGWHARITHSGVTHRKHDTVDMTGVAI